MVCICGHEKKSHAMIGKEHLGQCSFHTMFGGKAQPTCECPQFQKLTLAESERQL